MCTPGIQALPDLPVLKENYRKLLISMETKTSAPGRVCLFGEHQDYLNLPVIPAAINLRTRISGMKPESNTSIIIHADDLGKVFEIALDKPFEPGDPEVAYFSAGLQKFKDLGHEKNLKPFTCRVTSEIPIKSGLSSSAALLVAWLGFLNKLTGAGYGKEQIGFMAYEVEHDIMGIPCGMMDQISSAVGRIIHLQCDIPPIINKINTNLEGLVVVDTKIRKSTSKVHSVRVKETKDGLMHLAELVDYDIKNSNFQELEPYLGELDEIERKRLIAVFKNRDITRKAYQLLTSGSLDYDEIGRLLSEHQLYLRDYFEVSVEKIDAIIEAAIDAGAKGGKLTGAGLGGSVVILAPGCQDRVADAVREVDGEPYVVSIDDGLE